jgi:hypothetical protein
MPSYLEYVHFIRISLLVMEHELMESNSSTAMLLSDCFCCRAFLFRKHLIIQEQDILWLR